MTMTAKRIQDLTAELSVLEAITPEGHTWYAHEIAEILDVPTPTIQSLQRRAIIKLTAFKNIKKLRQHWKETNHKPEVQHPLNF